MKSYFLNLAISALRWYIGTGAFDRITGLIRELIETSASGDEKRRYVLDFARHEYNFISDSARFSVKAIIELTLLRYAIEMDDDE